MQVNQGGMIGLEDKGNTEKKALEGFNAEPNGRQFTFYRGVLTLSPIKCFRNIPYHSLSCLILIHSLFLHKASSHRELTSVCIQFQRHSIRTIIANGKLI